MNNILIALKRFFTNKNTVTIICVIAILGLLYWGYTYQIKSAVNPVQVPVAKSTIQPKTEITSDLVGFIQVPQIAVSENVILSSSKIIGKFSNVNAVIPSGSMFYSDVLVDKENLPDTVFSDVKDGEIPYQFPVTIDSTYGNSIYPGNKIDIYMKAKDDNGQIMVGRLLENVEVLAVKDSQGKNVFEDTTEARTPSYLIFGLPEKIHILLRKAAYLENQDVELFPVPHGGTAPVTGNMQVDIEALQNYIESRTVNLLPEQLETGENNNSTDNTTNNNQSQTNTDNNKE